MFSKVWIKRKTLKTDTSFKSYLFTIALNSIRKQFNKLAKFNEAKHEILFSHSNEQQGFDDRNDYQSLLSKLDQLIELMPEKRRQVFIKKKFEGKSLKEIGQELSISTKTVEYHLSEAMKFLKTEFEKLNIDGLIFFHLFLKSNSYL